MGPKLAQDTLKAFDKICSSIAAKPHELEVNELFSIVRGRLRNLPEAVDATKLSDALAPVYEMLMPFFESKGLDEDEVSQIMWDAYAAIISKTKLTEKMASLDNDVETWENMVVLLRQHDVKTVLKYPGLSRNRVCMYLAFAGCLSYAYAQMVSSGRQQILGTTLSVGRLRRGGSFKAQILEAEL